MAGEQIDSLLSETQKSMTKPPGMAAPSVWLMDSQTLCPCCIKVWTSLILLPITADGCGMTLPTECPNECPTDNTLLVLAKTSASCHRRVFVLTATTVLPVGCQLDVFWTAVTLGSHFANQHAQGNLQTRESGFELTWNMV